MMHSEKQCGSLNMPLPFDPAITVLCIYLRVMKMHVHTKPVQTVHSSFISSG